MHNAMQVGKLHQSQTQRVLSLLVCEVVPTSTSPQVSEGKTEEALVAITLRKLAALVFAFLSDFGKVTEESNNRLPSRMLVIVQSVAPVAFKSTALLKLLCCCVRKVAVENAGREAEKVTAQHLELKMCRFRI